MGLTVGGNVVARPQSFWQRTLQFDSFKNFLAGLGVEGRDKAASQVFSFDVLSQMELEKAYRGDWLARKIVDIPAFDSCRAWRAWQADQDQIEKLEEAERALGFQRKVMDAMVKARLYGGGAIVMGIKGQKFEEELNIEKVGEGDLVFAHVVSRWMISPGPIVRDITSPWFGEPEYYQRSNTPTSPQIGGVQPLETGVFGKEAGGMLNIHPSRVVRILGNDYPNMEIGPDAWGDSVLQTVIDAIKDAGLVGQSIAALTAKANVDVIKVPGLTQTLSTDKGTSELVARFSNANSAKSVVNSLLIDAAEEWNQLQVTFSGLPQVFQMYLMVACGAADIPATRLLGKSPDGQNSTGDSDLRNYYDKLQAEQKVKLTPTLSRLDEVLIRHVFGKRDKSIYYEWNPLWQMDDVQKSDIALKKAQAYKIDVDAGQISPDALRVARQNQLVEDGTYPGFDAALDDAEAESNEDVPEEAIPPHPALREKLSAQEVAQQQFEQSKQQQTEQHKERLEVQKKQPMFGKPGGGAAGKSNGKGNGAAKDALADDLAGGGQSALGFEVPYGGRRRKRGRPFDETEYPPVIRVGAIEDWSPDQPRIAAGSPEGGQWGGGGSRNEVANISAAAITEKVATHAKEMGWDLKTMAPFHMGQQKYKAAIQLGSNYASASWATSHEEDEALANVYGSTEKAWDDLKAHEKFTKEGGDDPPPIVSDPPSPALAAKPPWNLSEGDTSYEIVPGHWVTQQEAEDKWVDLQAKMGADAAKYAASPFFMTGFLNHNEWAPEHGTDEYAKWESLQTTAAPSLASGQPGFVPTHAAANPFEKKSLGEHKHFKASENAQVHQARVQVWIKTGALRNHTYRWMTKKLIEEGKSFIATTPQILSDLSAGISGLKVKIGESFAREAGAMQLKGDPKHQASLMLSKAMSMSGKPLDEMVALGWIPSADKVKAFNAGTTTSFPAVAAQVGHQTIAEGAEAKLKFAADNDQGTDAFLNTLSLAENSALKDKYGSIGAALTSAKAKVGMAKLAAAKTSEEQAAKLSAEVAQIAKTGATAAEMEKAKKTSSFYPEPASDEAKALTAIWNEKYQGVGLTEPSQLAEKVIAYKQIAAQISALAGKEQTAAKAAAEAAAVKAKEEYAKTHAAEIAKAAAAKIVAEAETAAHMKEVANLVAELGCSPNDAEAADAMIHLSGKSPTTLVMEFKKAKESGEWKGLPISPFEYGMLQSYVGSGYHTVNNALRKGSWNMQTHVFLAAINNALKKLPAYTQTIYRGINVDKSEQSEYTVGNVVPWKAFSSCGKSSHFGGNVIFTITPKGGFRDLGNMNPGEAGGEVLGMPGTLMKVTKVQGSPGSNMKVWVEELGF